MYDKLELSRLQLGLSLALDLRRKEMNVTLEAVGEVDIFFTKIPKEMYAVSFVDDIKECVQPGKLRMQIIKANG